MQDYFIKNPKRAEEFSLSWQDFYMDFSKNRITAKTLSYLLQLAKQSQLKEAIDALFSGQKINQTENRAAWHTALRDPNQPPRGVKKTLGQIKRFSKEILSGQWKGYTGKHITDVVNIGIGGSDLGPQMVCQALQYYKTQIQLHFISNIDGDHLREQLKKFNPETTLFIVVSKSFTTQETLTNAETVRSWFLQKATVLDIEKHFVAVSGNIPAVTRFGIAKENIFPMWEWVGGRFSLWGAAGLSICCAIGYKNFEKLLQGAHAMDLHFKSTAFAKNIPVVLALLTIWYNNFFKSETEAIIPYSEYLSKLVPYLQQAFMESNGKNIDRNGKKINYQTGQIVWGGTGTNAQHAFFQLLHQGTKLVPVQFIAFAEALYENDIHQQTLLAHCFAQSEALLTGTYKQPQENPYSHFEGNRPSTTLLIKKLTPENLGALLAIYEHKVFVEGVILNIYSFDQWGVELGKKIAGNTLKALQYKQEDLLPNKATRRLVRQV